MAINAQDPMTERALLAAVMLAPEKVAPQFLALPAEAFSQMRHRVLADLIREMIVRQTPVDPNTVLAAVMDQGLVSRIPGTEVHSIFSHPSSVAAVPEYVRWLGELYGRRRMAEGFQREVQALDAQWENQSDVDLSASVARVRLMLEEVSALAVPNGGEAPPTLADLLASTEDYDWIVPGLLERMDRLVMTGDEGFGKSEFIAQVVCCVAASIHPFLGEPILDGNQEHRVTIMDCENSQAQSRRRFRRMVSLVESTRDAMGLPPIQWDKRLFIDFAPGGMDLLKGGDSARLERFVASTAPDILVIGPLYKLHRADMNNEEAARELVGQLDSLRERYRCAIITEAHAGNGKDGDGNRMMRPRGSSLFLGWPEFGMGLRRNRDDSDKADVVAWRGHRDERDWPTDLFKAREGLLPWRPGHEYYDRPSTQWDPTA